ncbi:hypothetical protein GLOIN_2v1874912 [Rhizophagus irregularis DAOM 181602=DAOM 197198]|uniref:Uncharacterized protein n=2 Tax=Rhizophagus irregularis TaxID=588596 RepID=A0A2I1DV11_9GLOM|nr:hypothetical protein GLOIN_2v1874912 [Rhizophagus irregularis DAOM 181602=DAOM 197198]PKK72320.1 hypothetical protein RhiirC2_848509 [Rhizophagus irregularis]PKY13694.1 hypothetical protein RhiirB3_425567 [Rhizophagus irregularis]POG72782.1 hypothetical protein GLOIN_2v1874912 [Rhizophagus irregularis DAOM 181602=DAOM 197198]GET49821.1 hypothetical protein GLOIN_2v1874912 [Rhizophagus irregularis DAOM 181602=DAOM 197198]|eukprot:XP_025179648.1 hypothetical protein GLOIN_2v1874912 [Rhizophagus irregularis DAOM 181602=DAOM 197198]
MTTNDNVIDVTGCKQILRDSTHTTTDNKENADDNGNTKGHEYGKIVKCKQYGHYAKTCQTLML